MNVPVLQNPVYVALFFSIGVTLAAFLLLYALYRKSLARKFRARMIQKEYHPLVQGFMQTGQLNMLKGYIFPLEMKPYLLKMGRNLRGIHLIRFHALYRITGLFEYDCKVLMTGKKDDVTRTLGQSRAMAFDLPDAVFLHLMKHNDQKIRWAAVEYASLRKPQKLFSPIVSFLSEPRNDLVGLSRMVLHNLGKFAPDCFRFLTDIPQLERLNLVVLQVLAFQPITGAEKFILKAMRKTSSDEILIAGLGAIASRPHGSFQNSLLFMLQHPSATIRSLAVQSLRDYSLTAQQQLEIKKLKNDPDSRVRQKASETAQVHSDNKKHQQVIFVDSLKLGSEKFSVRVAG